MGKPPKHFVKKACKWLQQDKLVAHPTQWIGVCTFSNGKVAKLAFHFWKMMIRVRKKCQFRRWAKLIGMRAQGTSKGASHLLPLSPTILFSTSHISKNWLLFWKSNNGLTPIWIVICCDSIVSCNSPQTHFYKLIFICVSMTLLWCQYSSWCNHWIALIVWKVIALYA
jgi:hypothetical protein